MARSHRSSEGRAWRRRAFNGHFLTTRGRCLQLLCSLDNGAEPGATVLVNGATRAALGADVTVPLVENDDAVEESFKAQFAARRGHRHRLSVGQKRGAPSVLPPPRLARRERPCVGAIRGPNITLPSGVLRASAIELMGSGIGSVARRRLIAALGELRQATAPQDRDPRPCRRSRRRGSGPTAPAASC
jgi:hypothetical protein